ncbi:Fascin-like incomplete domain containing protein [Pandoravirus salinus]|uniref:Fascin-like incomplete domain containing protein n=1 Tax=Pandoravirus salinus TaxID=1349410 RepID=S4W0J3_9VIRU|nr:Fascin-like incomplete domain [Pandoravirus salinus]AGO83605.1 Fascin-like incomplete domain containing protein [Pandoravirus salinus]
MIKSSAVVALTTSLALLCLAVHSTSAYRYTVIIDASSTATLPAGATDVRVTLWGGGGGAASTNYCGAGGGSGATILNRTIDTASWGTAIETMQWTATVGQGGSGSSGFYVAGYGGNGGATVLVARAPGGAQLFSATAYGGGGAVALPDPDRRGCTGGAGGGQASSASGTVPGSGTPAGAADNNDASGPAEGATVGDVKAGGAGAGHGFTPDNNPFVDGAAWTGAGRAFAGGIGASGACRAWGGAAGFGGTGGSGRAHSRICATPPANSGAGGGSAYVCPPVKQYADSRGADGGVIIEYEYPVAPTPSPTRTPSPTASRTATPSRTPSASPTRTPSVSPTPSSQPWTQLVTLVSPISGKQLTPQDDGSVASLWVGASYKEKWTVARLSNGKYTFRGFNNRYLGANPGGWVRADATAVGSWEQWDVLINNGDQWTLKSVHGTYMGTTAAGVVYLNNNADLYWTKTTV